MKNIIDRINNKKFLVLSAFLVFVFLTGGGSRADITSLIILRPVAIILCGLSIIYISRQDILRYRFLFILSLMIFILVIAQLILLPPSIWQMLPGREIVVEINDAAGLTGLWRPISMTPGETWNALYALFVPLAVLLLAAQLTRDQLYRLLPLLIGLGLFSGFLGVLQVSGDPNSPAYLYRITNSGLAVGLFANRNHQAIFLAAIFPMLAVYASTKIQTESERKFRTIAALAIAAILIPLILVTGSRAGLVASILGIVSIAFLYRKPAINTAHKRRHKKVKWALPVIALTGLGLGALTVLLSRAETLERLVQRDPTEDLRFSSFAYVFQEAWNLFPFGSGFGSFPYIYKIIEPNKLLSPYYFNHAHNDWLELYLTGGFAALVLLSIAMISYVLRVVRVFRAKLDLERNRDISYARLGAIIIFLLALSSFVDYPLRVPSLACLLVIASLWLHEGHIDASQESDTLKA